MNRELVVERMIEVTRPGERRLGRHVEHDPASRAFAAPEVGKLVSRSWSCHAAPWDQGKVGGCTGFAEAGLLMTDPFYVKGRELTAADALALYGAATKLDRIPGHYPPDDTGSTGLAVMKAAKRAGFIKSYRHAFSFHAATLALTKGPTISGVNWYEGFDKPIGNNAECKIAGEVRGAHELCVLAIDVPRRLVRVRQSWGEQWGDHGYFVWSFETYERLLSERGDATIAEA